AGVGRVSLLGGVQAAGGGQHAEPVEVLAVAMAKEPLALARPGQVDRVGFPALAPEKAVGVGDDMHLGQLEAGAVVGGDGGQGVQGGQLADGDAGKAGAVGGRGRHQADAADGLDAGAGGGDAGHCESLSSRGLPGPRMLVAPRGPTSLSYSLWIVRY